MKAHKDIQMRELKRFLQIMLQLVTKVWQKSFAGSVPGWRFVATTAAAAAEQFGLIFCRL